MQSKKRVLHKFTALLLSLVMCISLLPAPAFAAGTQKPGYESDGEKGYGENQASGNGRGAWTPYVMNAVRFTVAWYPESGNEAGSTIVGTPIDIAIGVPISDVPNITYYYKSNFYSNQIMGQAYKAEKDTTHTTYTQTLYSTEANNIPRDIFHDTSGKLTFPKVSTYKTTSGRAPAGADKPSMSDYLVVDNNKTVPLNQILEWYIDAAGDGEFESNFKTDNFSLGRWRGERGKFYAFLEPVYYAVQKSSGQNWALTLREIKAMNDSDLIYDCNSATLGIANGLFTAQDWPQFGIKAVTSDATQVSKLDTNTYGYGLGIVSITPDNVTTNTDMASSHINIFLNEAAKENTAAVNYPKYQTTSFDYIGKPLNEDTIEIAKKAAILVTMGNIFTKYQYSAVTSLPPQVLRSQIASTDTLKLINSAIEARVRQLGITYADAKAIHSYIPSVNTEEFIQSVEKVILNNTDLAAVPSLDSLIAKISEDITIEDASTAAIQKIVSNKLSSTQSILSGMKTSSGTDKWGYKQSDGSNYSYEYEDAKILNTSLMNNMEPFADVNVYVNISHSDSYGYTGPTNTQAGLIKDFLEEVLSRVTYASYKNAGLKFSTGSSSATDWANSFDASSIISDSLMSVLGWGSFNGNDDYVDMLKEQLLAELKKCEANSDLEAFKKVIASTQFNINTSSAVAADPSTETLTLGMTLSEWALVDPYVVYKVIVDPTISETIRKFITTGVGSEHIDKDVENDIIQKNMQTLAAVFAGLGLNIASASEYAKLVNTYNTLNSISVVRRQEFAGKGTPTMNDYAFYENTISFENDVVSGQHSYTIDEAALSNAIKAALKILRKTDSESRKHISIRSIELSGETGINSSYAIDHGTPSANGFLTTQIEVITSVSSYGGTKTLEAGTPKSTSVLGTGETNSAAIARRVLSETPNTLRARATSKEIPSGSDKVEAYTLSSIVRAQEGLPLGSTGYSEGKVGLDGTISIGATVWAPASYGDIIYVKRTDTGYKVLNVGLNDIAIPQGGESNFTLNETVSLPLGDGSGDIAYKVIGAIPAASSTDYNTIAGELLKGTKEFKSENFISKWIDPGKNVRLGSDNSQTDSELIYNGMYSSLSEAGYKSITRSDGGIGRQKVVVLVEDLPITTTLIQYNIITDKANQTRVEGPIYPEVVDSTVTIEKDIDKIPLIEWETNSKVVTPSNWEDIPSNPINTDTTNTTVPITEETTVIYVHYKEDPTPQQSTGQANLTEKRITGSKLLSQISQQGLLSNDFSWQSAGQHHCGCHCKGCKCFPSCGCNCIANYSTPIDSHYKVIIHS